MFAVHNTVSAAIFLACNYRDLGYWGLAIGIKQLGTTANDPVVFLGYARQKARYIHKCNQWDIKAVAETYKTCGLFRSIDVQDPCQRARLLGHNSNTATIQACEAN